MPSNIACTTAHNNLTQWNSKPRELKEKTPQHNRCRLYWCEQFFTVKFRKQTENCANIFQGLIKVLGTGFFYGRTATDNRRRVNVFKPGRNSLVRTVSLNAIHVCQCDCVIQACQSIHRYFWKSLFTTNGRVEKWQIIIIILKKKLHERSTSDNSTVLT